MDPPNRCVSVRVQFAALFAALVVVLAQPAVVTAQSPLGFNFSDGRAFTKMAGKTADGCTNWFDSCLIDNNGYKDGNFTDLAFGTRVFASGVITAQWVSSTSFSGGASDNSQQQLYYTYLDDGDANPAMSDGVGVVVTFSGLSAWLAANQATHYQLRLYCATTWNLAQMTTNPVASIRLGAPNPANGSTQVTSLAVLETVPMQWLGDGGFPTATLGSAARGYGDSSTNLNSNIITITIPTKDATSSATRGSLAAIKLTPVNSAAAPATPLPAYGQAVTNNAPLAYWRLNELNGASVAADFFGNNNGTIGSNVTAGVSGPQSPTFTGFETNNTAMLLNGTTNSYLTMPTLNLNTNTVTITGWINPAGFQTNSAGLVFCRGGTTAAGLGFPSGGGNELRYTWNGQRSNISSGLTVPTNQWSFFALVVSPSGATLYLGTNLVLNSFIDSVTLSNQAFDAPLRIGFDPGASNRLFNGRIDEVAIYKRALTPGQVQLLYIAAVGCLGDPSITANPTNQTVFIGATGTFSVTATGATVLSYQWQVSTNGGASFANVSGATNTSYTTPATILPNNGNQYRAVVGGLCGTPATSTAATLSVTAPPLAAYAQAVTNSAPLAYWQLNEASGTVAADFYGVYDGTIGAGITLGVSGPQNPPFAGFSANNPAMQLNFAANSILTMPTFNLNTNTVTITGWINPTGIQADAAGLVFCRGGNSNTVAGLNFSSGGGGNGLRYTWNNDRFGVNTGLVVPTNQWSFFALVVTPTGATLYLGTNGVLNSFTDSVSLPIQAFGAPLLIGSDPASGGRLYRGQIDEVALYKRALTPIQVQQLYSGGAGCPGGPSITNQPTNQTVLNGLTATFSVGASGPTVLSYQWQISTNSGASFADLAGANNSSYTTPTTTLANNGSQYRTLVSGLCGAAVTSAVATLSVELGSYPQTVTNLVPFAYWRLNEPNGSTTATDFVGSNNGTIGSAVTAGVSGPRSPSFPGFETGNTAMQLNSVAANSILTMPSLFLNTNTVTITGWFNPTGIQADSAGLIFCRGGTTIAGLNFSGSANELRYTWNGNRYDVSTGLFVPTNQWSFFALVVAPTGATLYMGTNGVLNSFTDAVSLPNQGFDASLLLGSDPASGTRLFNGRIDEVAIYNRSLTPAQIQLLYTTAAGCPGNPSITSQPTNQTIITGSTASFSVAATGPTVLTYQWQSSTNGGASFANLAGATSTNYTTPVLTLADTGNQYRTVVSGLCGTAATSSVATVTVNSPPPLTIYAQTVTNSNPFAYWRLNETNGAAIVHDFFGVYNGTIGPNVTAGVSGPQSPQFSGFEVNNAAMQFDSSSGTGLLTSPALGLNTNTVTITGWINPTGIQGDSAGLVFCRSGNTVAGLNFPSGGGNELRYTWNNDRFGVSTGLVVPTNQWSFFAWVVRPTGATVYLATNGVLNSFTDTVSLPSQNFDASLLIGYDSVNSRRYNGRIDEVAIYNRALSVAELQQFYITGAGCPGSPSITNQPANQTVNSGSSATFSVAATGPTLLSYQWQSSTNGGAGFADISGGTNASYITPALALGDSGEQYRAVVSGLCGTPAISAAATVTVNVAVSNLGAYGDAVTNRAPIAYWRLNETNGTVAADFFGVNNGAIGAGVTAGIAGPRSPAFAGFASTNTAMQLNYASDSILTMPALNLNTNTVTITGWMNPTGIQADWTGLVFCRGGGTTAGLNFSDGGNNELRYTWNGDRFGVSTGLSVPTNQWSFFALVVTPTNATVYVGANGALNSFADSVSEPSQSFASSLLIGLDSASGARLFKGGIDDVAVFNKALTFTQVQQLYISGIGCPGAPTITNQPVSQTVANGTSATFTVGASSATQLSYQWQISTNTGASFADIGGATSASHTTPVLGLGDNGTQYRVRVTDLCGTPVISAVATQFIEFGDYPQAVTNSAPLAYWRLNETNGATVAADFFGVYNGTIAPNITGGVSGPQSPAFPGFETGNTAMQLNYGADSILTLPTFNLNTNSVTIAGWINPTGIQADAAGIVFCRSGTTIAGLNFPAGGVNELRYTWNNARFNISTGLVVPTNAWSLFALVVTPTNATVYLGANGTLNSFTDIFPQPDQAFDAPLLVGSDPAGGGRLFKGRIDEIALYNRALTPLQIQHLYTSAGFEAPPLTPFEMWLLDHFGCVECTQAGAQADPDGDGLNNEQEYLAGTDPNNPASTLIIAGIDRLGSDIRITWTSEGGHGYVVQTNASPGSGFVDFSPLISVPSNAVESTTNYLHVGGATNAPVRFYRVRLVP